MWGWGIIYVSIFILIFCLISSLACVLSLLVVCYMLYNCSKPWFDRSIPIAVLLQLPSGILLLVKDLFWRHLWYALLTVLQICFSKNKLPVLIPNHRNLSIALCHLKYDCIFLIQGIPVQIPYLCWIYTADGHHIPNQLPRNVLCLKVKMLLQGISDYPVHQLG